MGRPFEQIENLVGYHRHMTGALIAEQRMRRNAMTMVVAAEAPPLAADAAGFSRFVDRARAAGALEDDDTTVVRLWTAQPGDMPTHRNRTTQDPARSTR